MEISEITEKNSTGLNIWCEDAVEDVIKGVVKDVVKSAAENAVKNADDLEVSKDVEINTNDLEISDDVDRNVESVKIFERVDKNAAEDVDEKIFWWSRNFQYFFTTFSFARWSTHNVSFENCNFELRTKLSHVSFFDHLMKFSLSNVLYNVFVIGVFVSFSIQTPRFFRKSRSSRILIFVTSLKSFSM